MKVKVLKLFGDGKRLYEVNQVIEITKERYEEFNSTSHGLLVEEIKEMLPDKGVDISGNVNSTSHSKGKVGNKCNS